ncbi:MAG: RHS repeat-associated core domain-containing protein [Chloroflexota bacterium]|nr:RHS repeat-associated core domain-containing protein [Chloroflexota bacterium]
MRDSSGLQYHRARYYSPALGMWISEDPLETPNRYGYVGGNVVNRVDPTGLFDTSTCQVEAGDYLERIALQVGVIVNGRPLARGSSSASDIQTGWRAIWELNRNNPVNPLGNNPSLIRPGWQLALPPNRLGACTGGQSTGQTTDCPPIIPDPVPVLPPPPGDDYPWYLDSTCQRNRAAVFPLPNLKRLNSIGAIVGLEVGANLWGAFGPSIGATPVIMYGMQGGYIDTNDCFIYPFSLEVGGAVGAELNQGVFAGLIWSTSTAGGYWGVTAGVSADVGLLALGLNIGLSRTLNSCDYAAFYALGGPITPAQSTGSATISGLLPGIPCSLAANQLGISYNVFQSLGSNIYNSVRNAADFIGSILN